MPIDSIIVSACVVAMFVVFAAVLYWGERQTRALPRALPVAQPSKATELRRAA